MKLLKTQSRQTLLSLCSFVLIVLMLCGCQKQRLTIHEFTEMVNEAYGLEEHNDSSDPVSLVEAKALLEPLCHQTLTFQSKATYLTKEEASKLIQLSIQLYLDTPSTNQDQVIFQNEIKDVRKMIIPINDHLYQIDEGICEVGDLILIEDHLVRKVVRVEKNQIETVEPAFDELIKDLTIDQIVEVKPANIELAEGVEWTSVPTSSQHNYNLSFKVHFMDPSFELSSDFGKLLGLNHQMEVGKKWEKVYTKQFESLSIFPDFNVFCKDYIATHQKEEKANLATNKFKSGYEVDGTISLSQLQFHPEIVYHEGILEKCVLDLSYDFESKLTYKGKLEKDLLIGKIHLPVGNSGVMLDCNLYLNVNANGEMNLSYQFATHTKCEYSNHHFTRVNTHTSTFSGSQAMKLLFGPKMRVDLSFLGARITNIDLLAEAELKLDGKIQIEQSSSLDQIYLSYQSDVYLPIIKIKMGTKQSLMKALGLTFEDRLINEKRAYRYSIDRHRILLYECTKEASLPKEGCLNISDYILYLPVDSFAKLQVTSIPEGYQEEDLDVKIIGDAISYQDGIINAKHEGDVEIIFATKDQKYQVTCYIFVSEIESEESV